MGYKGPKVARFLHPSGYREVLVYNVNDLSKVDLNTQAARIAHTVGKRKRTAIIAEAKKLNIKILNVKVSAAPEKKEGEEEAEGEEKTTEEIEEEATKEVEEQTAEKEEQPEAEEAPAEKEQAKEAEEAKIEKPKKEKKPRKSKSKKDAEEKKDEEGEEKQ